MGQLCDIRWPSPDGAFLLRLQHKGEQIEHVLSDPCNSDVLVPSMDYRNLNEERIPLLVSATALMDRENAVVVSNKNSRAALLVHLRLFDSTGMEMLPVWWSDDFFNLLPGESRRVTWSGLCGSLVAATGFNVLSGSGASRGQASCAGASGSNASRADLFA